MLSTPLVILGMYRTCVYIQNAQISTNLPQVQSQNWILAVIGTSETGASNFLNIIIEPVDSNTI